jgi:transcriptional antiterminator RfaH
VAFWGVVQTQVRREHVAEHHLEGAGFETYLPRIATKTIARVRVVPLFPSYIFVRIINQWHVITGTIGVNKLLGQGEQPSQLPDQIVADIRSREKNGRIEIPTNGLHLGDTVLISQGVFAGRLAIYHGQAPHDRVLVLMALLGSEARPISLAKDHIEAAGGG